MDSELFLNATGSLQAANAVAALLVLDDGHYVMQLRDDIPGIFYPGHWGCFGGAVEAGEQPGDALRRELAEELEFEPDGIHEFVRFDFDLRPLGQPPVFRLYFEVPATQASFERMVLHEGAKMEAFRGHEILRHRRVTPYDAFAIWLHHSRSRFS